MGCEFSTPTPQNLARRRPTPFPDPLVCHLASYPSSPATFLSFQSLTNRPRFATLSEPLSFQPITTVKFCNLFVLITIQQRRGREDPLPFPPLLWLLTPRQKRLLFSKPYTLFHFAYHISPSFAILTKTAGVYGDSSQFGTEAAPFRRRAELASNRIRNPKRSAWSEGSR